MKKLLLSLMLCFGIFILAGCNNKRMEDEYVQNSLYFELDDNLELQFTLPDGFNFEPLEDKDIFNIKLYNEDNKDAYVSFKVQDEIFGVCGTGLKSDNYKTIYGNEFNVGYYNDNEIFNFICMEILGKNVIILNETDKLTKEDNDKIIDMAKTINVYNKDALIYEHRYENTMVEEIMKDDELDDIDYYIYSVGGLVGKYDGRKFITLRELLLDEEITIDELLDKAEKELDADNIRYCNDGGSIEYHYPNYTMIKLNTLLGNNDLYFAPQGTSLDELEVVDNSNKKIFNKNKDKKEKDELTYNEVDILALFTKDFFRANEDDSNYLIDIVSNGSWQEGTADCINNLQFVIDSKTYYYHSECGTINDNANNRSLTLTSEQKEYINSMIEEHFEIVLNEM